MANKNKNKKNKNKNSPKAKETQAEEPQPPSTAKVLPSALQAADEPVEQILVLHSMMTPQQMESDHIVFMFFVEGATRKSPRSVSWPLDTHQ